MATDEMTIGEIVAYLKTLQPDGAIEDRICGLVDQWNRNKDEVRPLSFTRDTLDKMRELPRGIERQRAMNTFLRTLSRPEIFSAFLDMLRYQLKRTDGSEEQYLSEVCRKTSKHAIYGWCAQTRLAKSSLQPTANTTPSEDGVQAFLGNTPTCAWTLSMNIWQPNPNAKGFKCGDADHAGIIAEPPHSHPFDFASAVVIGEMHQSTYSQGSADFNPNENQAAVSRGRYNGILLEHVHGVWPPHNQRERSAITLRENRFKMNAGDIYYQSANAIHDVQIDGATARERPAITLFMRAESYTKPHSYICAEMADFHDRNPTLKNQGHPLPERDWSRKLEMVAKYVRGETDTLDLRDVIKYENDYAFFHV